MLLDWGSKRQTVTAKSSTESETVASVEGVSRSALPLLDLISAIFGAENTGLIHKVDNDAQRLSALSGASNALRYLSRHQGISLSFLRDVCDENLHEGFRKLMRCGTEENNAHGLTKVFSAQGQEKIVMQFSLNPLSQFSAYLTEAGPIVITNLHQDEDEKKGIMSKVAGAVVSRAKKATMSALRNETLRSLVAETLAHLIRGNEQQSSSASSSSGSGGVASLPAPSSSSSVRLL